VKTSSVQKCNVDSISEEQVILLFTSGSSGAPKLASLNVEHFIASAQSTINALFLTPESRWLLTVPLFHVSGLSILFRCLLSGSSIVLTSDLLIGHPFASHVSLVPTQLLRVLEKESPFPYLKCALIGGAPISESLIEKALEKKIPLYLTYGMTEMASQITMTSQSDVLLPLHLGKPLIGKEVSFASDGEILVKGSSLFNGYDTPIGPQKKLLADGWFATGDLGSLDASGNLNYKGRKDNLFISGGENIYPEPIEEALGTISGVLQSLVIPLEDLEFGKRPVAFVHMEGELLSKEEFQERLIHLLPKFCIPIHFFPFPKELLEKGFKVKRSELREILLQKV
jgi:O-succinylbenzoic acid--CoA ligase